MQEPRFKNVALLPEDHELLRQIADKEQRAMTRQLSVMIRRLRVHTEMNLETV
jgi:hypothetical protein